MSGVSTHILDTASGRPASGIKVHLFRDDEELAVATTDKDGRIPRFLPPDASFLTGKYRMLFDVGAHWSEGFYPEVSVTFWVRDAGSHYHIPLLMSPYGFTTYRGS